MWAGVAGSITVNALVATTKAFTGVGAQLNQNIAANAAQSIEIQAVDDTAVTGSAGVSNSPSLVDGGAAVDASAIQKNTLAFLGGEVNSGGNISVEAFSDEEATSTSATTGLSVVTSLAGSGGIVELNVTTKAYVDSGADVFANGSVQIAADDQSATNATAGSATLAAGARGRGSGGGGLEYQGHRGLHRRRRPDARRPVQRGRHPRRRHGPRRRQPARHQRGQRGIRHHLCVHADRRQRDHAPGRAAAWRRR